jgi:hypothetical protein
LQQVHGEQSGAAPSITGRFAFHGARRRGGDISSGRTNDVAETHGGSNKSKE